MSKKSRKRSLIGKATVMALAVAIALPIGAVQLGWADNISQEQEILSQTTDVLLADAGATLDEDAADTTENDTASSDGDEAVESTDVEATQEGTAGEEQLAQAYSDSMSEEEATAECVAQIGEEEYETLAAAVEAAKSGDTITLLCDASGSGIKIDSAKLSGLTIDFNGHTYTIDGSTGTETQCLQLLTGGSIAMKDGAIVANTTSAETIIQNYCNLTLESMTLDTTQESNGESCVLSHECGILIIANSVINGGVNIDGGTKVVIKEDSTVGSVSVNSDSNVAVVITDSTVGSEVSGDNVTMFNCVADGYESYSRPYGVVALVGDTTYTSLGAALEAAKDGGTVRLLDDVTDVVIPEGYTVTIDMGVSTISSENMSAITNRGNLTLTGVLGYVDSTVSETSALYNAPGATVSLEDGVFLTGSGGYVVQNLGTMIIDSATVYSEDETLDSVILNGYTDQEQGDSVAELIINNGDIDGGLHCITNGYGGALTINGGELYTYWTGEYSGNSVIENLNNQNAVSISSGVFSSEVSAYVPSDVVSIKYEFAFDDEGDECPVTEYIVGEPTISSVLEDIASFTSNTVIVLAGTSLENVPDSVTVINETSGYITVNGNITLAPGESVVINDTGEQHNTINTEAKAPTCTEAGNIAYWYCDECGKYFSDKELEHEITQADTVIPATGHKNVTEVEAKAATETEAGNIAYWYCSDCGKYYADEALTKEISKADTVIKATGSATDNKTNESETTDNSNATDQTNGTTTDQTSGTTDTSGDEGTSTDETASTMAQTGDDISSLLLIALAVIGMSGLIGSVIGVRMLRRGR